MNMEFCVGEVELTYKTQQPKQQKIASSRALYNAIRPTYSDDKIEYRETFKVVFTNNRGEILGYATICEGGIDHAPVDIRIIFQAALLTNACGIMLVHNHPSGDLTPSQHDKTLTQQVVEAGKALRIQVLDHIIINKESYYSFQDNGLI